ncbi:MAG: disulfide bond formation protein B [Sulfitobacter sp.]
MTRRHLIIAATFGSAGLLLGAFVFQHFGGLAPCKMCIWQRYPHGIAIFAGIVAFFLPMTLWLLIGAASAATTAAIGFYHVGVEQGWWQGPTTCTSGPIDGLSADDLLDQILAAPLVRCDDIPWQMLGISMAGWNGILSAGLTVIWIAAIYRR